MNIDVNIDMNNLDKLHQHFHKYSYEHLDEHTYMNNHMNIYSYEPLDELHLIFL